MAGLKQYLAAFEAAPFSWEGNNCMTFVSGALRAQGLTGLPEAWCAGYGNTREARAAYRRLLSEYGVPDIIAAFDDRFTRVMTLHPRDGMICARPSDAVTRWAFGVAWQGGCTYLADGGAVWSDVTVTDKFWWPA